MHRKLTKAKKSMKEKLVYAIGLLLILLAGCYNEAISQDQLKYTFELSAHQDRIDVELVYRPKVETDTISLLIPSSYDRNKMSNTVTIDNLQLISKGKLIKKGFDTYCYVGGDTTVTFTYSIPTFSSDTVQLPCSGDDYFIPAINQKFFHMYGDKSLVQPHFDTEEQRLFDVEIAWHNFPSQWHIANDYGVSAVVDGERENQYKYNLLEGDIGSSLFIGGALRKSSFAVDDKTFYVYLFGDWGFDEEKILATIQKIGETNLAVWAHFHHSKEYVITVMQKGRDDCGRYGGRNMFDSFVYYLPGKYTNDYFPLFYHALTHEFTHSWVGVDMVASSPNPGSMKWFTEGITDYYANRVTYQAGFIDEAGYLAKLNSFISDYRRSPYVSITNSDFVSGYIYDERLENFAYYKGAVFAFYLDGHIRKQSANKYNLDDYMSALYSDAGMMKIQDNLTLEVLIDIAKEALEIDLANIFEKHITNGEIIPITSPLINGLTMKKEASFQYGFDYINSIDGEVVTGVIRHSNAYRSGMRDGQKLTAIKGMTKDPNGKMIFEVQGDGGKMLVEFNPKGPPIDIPVVLALKSIE